MKKFIDLILKQLDENPGRVFGLVYPYILTLILLIGLFYLTKVEVLSRQTVPAVLPDTVKVVDLVTADGKEVPPVDINKVSKPDAELISKGKSLFSANCSSCHGEGGNGDGPAGAALNPKPRNFHATDGWKNGRKISEIYKTLQLGIAGSGMSAYDYLTPADRFSIIHYVRSFMKDPPADLPAELTALDNTYNLSRGGKQAGQVPVSFAWKMTLDEGKKNSELISSMLKSIDSDKSEGAELFKQVTNKKNNALITLYKSKLWQQSSQDFINLVSENIPMNGFNGSVHGLNSSQISVLHGYLKNVFQN